MKLQLALAAAILAVSTSAAQAADTRTPDILGSVSAEAVQALSKADASHTRGEYYYYYNRRGQRVYGSKFSFDGKIGWRGSWSGDIYVYKSVKRPWWKGGGYTVSR